MDEYPEVEEEVDPEGETGSSSFTNDPGAPAVEHCSLLDLYDMHCRLKISATEYA